MNKGLLIAAALVAMAVAAPCDQNPVLGPSYGLPAPGNAAQAGKGRALNGPTKMFTVAGSPEIAGARGETLLSGSNPATTPEPSLILAGSALLLIGLVMKKSQKKAWK